MKAMNHNTNKLPIRNIGFHIFACVLVLVGGLFGLTKLAGSKKTPVETEIGERAVRVEAIRVQPIDVPVVITGYGEVNALKVVAVSPEVSGRIVEIHPRLDTGELIPSGETLFQIDSRNYDAAAKDARALVVRWENTIKRLEKKYATDRQRLKTLDRNRELAEQEFLRLRNLFQKSRVGTRSGVEKAEQAFNITADQVDRMKQALILYPIQIKEARSSLVSALARLAVSDADLERCTVSVDFDARVKSVSIERGQYVTPARQVLTLADDSILEIYVPVDSRDARKWLQFKDSRGRDGTAWFSGLKPVPCSIRWTEEDEHHAWQGLLHRLVRFDQKTRTLTVAVRVDSTQAAGNGTGGLPLVEGMFCAVDIPGKTLHRVYRLPSWAVSYRNTVYTVHDNRLKTVPVKVDRVEGDTTIVSEGLRPSELVVSTRLIDPLENILLEVTNPAPQGDFS